MNHLVPTVQSDVATALTEYARQADGAFAANTTRAVASDTRLFSSWCADHGHAPLPATPATISAFIVVQAQEKAAATVARYMASIAHMHRAADLPDPTKAQVVKLALRKTRRSTGTRQRQAAPLNASILDRLAVVTTESPRDLRDVALLRMARDILARRSELVAINVDDIERADDGSGTVLIRRSKTDQEGQGAAQFLAADTICAIDAYRDACAVDEGALFLRLFKGGATGRRLDAGSIPAIFKRLASMAGIDATAVSGHSARVGMAQDLTAAGADLPALMHAGRWKTAAMPARYGERQAARRGAVARFYGVP